MFIQRNGLQTFLIVLGFVLLLVPLTPWKEAQGNCESLVLLRQFEIPNSGDQYVTSLAKAGICSNISLSSISIRTVNEPHIYGTIALQCGAFDQALDYLGEALVQCTNSQGNGSCALERTLLGHAYAETGHMEDALALWRSVSEAIFYLLGHSESELVSGNAQAAERFARRAISLDPHTSWKKADFDWVNVYSALGNALAAQGRWDEAFSAYQSALADSATPTPYLAAPDIALMHLEKPETALSILEAAQ